MRCLERPHHPNLLLRVRPWPHAGRLSPRLRLEAERPNSPSGGQEVKPGKDGEARTLQPGKGKKLKVVVKGPRPQRSEDRVNFGRGEESDLEAGPCAGSGTQAKVAVGSSHISPS